MSHRLQRGVSLIEALVAFAIMAFGMMAVVGMQGTMRGNADIARQRAEAVRLAQDSLEEWRGFSTISTTANRTAYQDVDGNSTRTVAGTNATYTVARRALARAAVAGTVSPDGRGVVVDVTWVDRTNQPQLVRLSSAVAGVAPELGASLVLSTNTDPAVAPLNRHRAIPPGAVGGVPVSVCTNCSGYLPPGQTGGDRVAWMFNNRTAEITICTTSATTSSQLASVSTPITCGSNKALLLSGFVRQLPDGPPAVNAAADPVILTPREFTLQVSRTIPTPTTSVNCFQEAPLSPSNAVAYVCAVPVTTDSPAWSGNVVFSAGSGLDMADELSDDDTDELKVCRYFGSSGRRAPTYAAIGQPLTNQNFLIMQAGSGGAAYSCPNDAPPTFAHQPQPTS